MLVPNASIFQSNQSQNAFIKKFLFNILLKVIILINSELTLHQDAGCVNVSVEKSFSQEFILPADYRSRCFNSLITGMESYEGNFLLTGEIECFMPVFVFCVCDVMHSVSVCV